MIYALVKNGYVDNVIKAEQDFIDKISARYDACILIQGEVLQPSPGDLWDGSSFSSPPPDDSGA